MSLDLLNPQKLAVKFNLREPLDLKRKAGIMLARENNPNGAIPFNVQASTNGRSCLLTLPLMLG